MRRAGGASELARTDESTQRAVRPVNLTAACASVFSSERNRARRALFAKPKSPALAASCSFQPLHAWRAEANRVEDQK